MVKFCNNNPVIFHPKLLPPFHSVGNGCYDDGYMQCVRIIFAFIHIILPIHASWNLAIISSCLL